MSIPFGDNIELNGLSVFNMVIQRLGSRPGSPVEGQWWYYNTNHRPEFFDGTAVRTLLHDGVTLDQIAAAAADVSLGTHKITNLADPTANQDAATMAWVKSYADGVRDPKDDVRVATAAALPANTRTGNVLTATANGALTVDGVAVNNGDRVLVKDEATGANNGIYTVTDKGSGGTPFILTRASDADSSAEVTQGVFTWSVEGTANQRTGWLLTTGDPITLNTTSLTFSQVGASSAYIAGNGLVLTGSTFDVVGTANRITANADSIDISGTYVGQTSITTLGTIGTGTWQGTAVAVANGGTGATTAAGARTNLGATGKYSALIGNGAATSFTITQATHGQAADRTNIVQVLKESTGDVWVTKVSLASNGDVTISFAVAPANNEYRVTIMG